MEKEKACGCIIVKDKKVLVVQAKTGFWGLPKGHVEGDETEEETARREVKEETNLDVEIDTSKRYEIHYTVKDNVPKEVCFFPAKVIGGNEKKQDEEIKQMKWVPVEEVSSALTHDNIKEMIEIALKDLGYIK